jgi:MerR family transcriptional regulator, heat shock protein HspR
MAIRAITDAAAKAGITAGTLRQYDRLGLLTPQRDSLGRRLYTDRDIERAREIACKRTAERGRGLRNARRVESLT